MWQTLTDRLDLANALLFETFKPALPDFGFPLSSGFVWRDIAASAADIPCEDHMVSTPTVSIGDFPEFHFNLPSPCLSAPSLQRQKPSVPAVHLYLMISSPSAAPSSGSSTTIARFGNFIPHCLSAICPFFHLSSIPKHTATCKNIFYYKTGCPHAKFLIFPLH